MIRISTLLSQLPPHAYTAYYNYAYYEATSMFYDTFAEGPTTEMIDYTLFNKRHKSTGRFRQQRDNKVDGEWQGILHLTPWSWDVNQNTQENRLGLVRPGAYAFNDYIVAEVELRLARVRYPIRDALGAVVNIGEGLCVIGSREQHYYYDSVGRMSYTLEITRAPFALADYEDVLDTVEVTTLANSLIANAHTRIVNESSNSFPSSTLSAQFHLVKNIPAVEVTRYSYQELSAELHTILTEKAALEWDPEQESYVEDSNPVWESKGEVVRAPIPRIHRVSALDTGKWLPVSLSESPAASAARYSGKIFNNGYINLNTPGDVGYQQIIGAADADFVFYWEREHAQDFNDVRALKAALNSYMGLLSTFSASHYGFRMAYLPYVAAVIRLGELTRGIGGAGVIQGVHKHYPQFVNILNSYDNYLTKAFELIKIDLGANDSAGVLKDHYIRHISNYNSHMAGKSLKTGLELAKLGTAAQSAVGTVLSSFYEFQIAEAWADIDKALTDAYMRDSSLSGSIEINDPAITVNLGDIVNVNFLDTPGLQVRATGLSYTLSPNDLDYVVSVRRLL